jgi:hypothetical protein
MIKPYFRANPEGKEDLLNTAAITEERKPNLLRMNLFLKTINRVGEGILHSPELYSFHSAHATAQFNIDTECTSLMNKWAFTASHFYMRVDANLQISCCRRPKTDRHMFLIFFNLQSSNGSNQI